MHRMRTQFRSEIDCSESALKDYCLESLKQLGIGEFRTRWMYFHQPSEPTRLSLQEESIFSPPTASVSVFYHSGYLIDRQVKQQMSGKHLMRWVYSVQ